MITDDYDYTVQQLSNSTEDLNNAVTEKRRCRIIFSPFCEVILCPPLRRTC